MMCLTKHRWVGVRGDPGHDGVSLYSSPLSVLGTISQAAQVQPACIGPTKGFPVCWVHSQGGGAIEARKGNKT